MANVKHVIRKLQQTADNDVQFWPVVVSLCVFGGFLLGIVLIYLNNHVLFWPAMIALPILIGALIIGLRLVSNRYLKRSMQIALVFSLIVNILILIVANEKQIFARFSDLMPAAADVKRQRTARPVPEFHRQSRIQQEINERVQAETPEPDPDQLQKEETRPEQTPPRPQPLPVPKPQETPQPNVPEKQQPNETPPRQANTSSRISRQTQTTEIHSGVTADTAQLRQQSTRQASTQQRPTNLEKQTAENNTQKRELQPTPTTVGQHNTPRVSRQQQENSPQTNSTSLAQLPRSIGETPRVASLAAVPQPQTPKLDPAQPEVTPNDSQVAKQTTVTSKQRTTSQPTPSTQDPVQGTFQPRQLDAAQPHQTVSAARPVRERSMIAPSVNVPTNATAPRSQALVPSHRPAAQRTAQATTTTKQSTTIRSTSQRQADVSPAPAKASDAPAATPTQVASRLPRGPSSANVASAPQSVDRVRTTPDTLTSPATTAATLATPQGPTLADKPVVSASTAVVQQSRSSTSSNLTNVRSADVTTVATAAQVPRPSPTRASADSQPSIHPTDRERPVPARANLTTPTATTTAAIESPAPVQPNDSSGQLSHQPAPLVLNKAPSTGTAGLGRSQNLDRVTPTATGNATAALDSAARERATQTESGSAFSPSQSAPIRRSLADQPAPSASQQVSANTIAQVPGSSELSATNSTTSAVSIDSKSNADLGEITASRGNVQVDVGEPRMVQDDTPGQRAAGGGQPEPNFQSDSNRLARQRPGGAPSTSIAATLDDQQAAPQGGGGTPSTSELNPDATAVVRADSGGSETLSSGPTSSAITGPAQHAPAATDLAQMPASRAEAAEAVPGELAAGGGDEEEDEEQRRRRLARAALAAGAPTALQLDSLTAELPSSSSSGVQPGSAPPDGPTGPQATEVARADSSDQPLAEAASSGPSADAGSDQAGNPQLARAEAAADGRPDRNDDRSARDATGSPARADTGPAIATTPHAAVPSTDAPSGRTPPSQPLDAQDIEATKLAGEAGGITTSGPLGVVAGPTAVSDEGAADAVAGQQRTSPADSGPMLAGSTSAGSPARSAPAMALPGTLAVADVPISAFSRDPESRSASDAFSGGQDVGPVKREAAGSVLLNIDAADGPGGLGTTFAPDAGINSRQARRDSPVLRIFSDARIVRANVGGSPGTSTAAVTSTEGFRNREPGSGRGPQGMVNPQTEAAIESGLVFLKNHQAADGSWSLNRFGQDRADREYQREPAAALDSDTAATGLALMAFQGAGYHHKDFKYAQTISRGIRWLLENQKEDGDLFVREESEASGAVWFYSHGIAAMALSEAYGMTQDPELREPTQRALDFLVKTQDPDHGGWRYTPGVGTDTSVTGWVFMAMYSGKIAGLNLPESSFKRVESWLNLCQKSRTERHLYRYNPYAPDTREQRHGRTPNETMTAVGLTLRIYTGWSTDDAYLLKGADHLLSSLPEMGLEQRVQYAHMSRRDAYYWYYATQVMAHLGGERWNKWNSRLHPLLLDTQTHGGPMAGSWDPIRPTVDRWGPNAGRIYVTTLNLLSLEAPYRKLPIYKATVAEGVR